MNNVNVQKENVEVYRKATYVLQARLCTLVRILKNQKKFDIRSMHIFIDSVVLETDKSTIPPNT